MELLDEHIDAISSRLTTEGIKDARLHADLLDHICTYIECREDEAPFDRLLSEAMLLLAPNGMHEIEEERFFLFHFQKQITMKRILFFSGFAATFLITSGFTFKLMAWPGANVMMVLGYLFLFISVMLIAANAMKHINEHSAAYRVRIFTGVIAAVLMIVGAVLKIGHMPGASILFVLGMLLFNFIFLPMFFYQLYRKSISGM